MNVTRIKQIRNELSLTQVEFSALLNTSLRTYQKWEQSEAYPSSASIQLIRIMLWLHSQGLLDSYTNTAELQPVSKESILQVVAAKHGIKMEYLGLEKTDGFYYWTGCAASMFSESCTHFQSFSDAPIESWVNDFAVKLKDWQENWADGPVDFNVAIEQLEWAS